VIPQVRVSETPKGVIPRLVVSGMRVHILQFLQCRVQMATDNRAGTAQGGGCAGSVGGLGWAGVIGLEPALVLDAYRGLPGRDITAPNSGIGRVELSGSGPPCKDLVGSR
jgi:hypothetical protein